MKWFDNWKVGKQKNYWINLDEQNEGDSKTGNMKEILTDDKDLGDETKKWAKYDNKDESEDEANIDKEGKRRKANKEFKYPQKYEKTIKFGGTNKLDGTGFYYLQFEYLFQELDIFPSN